MLFRTSHPRIARPLAAALLTLTGASAAHAADYQVTILNLTSGLYFTPPIASAHPGDVAMFTPGQAASAPMQAIAEGGDTAAMAALLESIDASVATADGLVAPGASVTLDLSDGGSGANTVLSVTGMLLPTNDGFLGLNSMPLSRLANGPVTVDVIGYDAGTEANDEVLGSGASGEPGFPAPPPVVASGTGTGATGLPGTAEGFVHVHRNVIGDLDPNGGASDINAAVHRWLNPVARITVRRVDGGASGDGPSAVGALSALDYSSSSVEVFWEPATSGATVTGYEVSRDGATIATLDGLSLFEEGLAADTAYRYDVVAIDADGARGPASSVTVRTRAN